MSGGIIGAGGGVGVEVGSLHILLIAVSGGSFACDFIYTCVTGGGR